MIYINPPYAEAASATQITETGLNKSLVAENLIGKRYSEKLGGAKNELFTQFFMRVYSEIHGCILASFSTLKYLNAKNFILFRSVFKADFLKGFISPASTFDNVRGQFPIGFLVWDTKIKKEIKEIRLDIFDQKNYYLGQKSFYAENGKGKIYINDWYRLYYDKNGDEIGVMNTRGNDFLNQNYIRISSDNNYNHTNIITPKNLIESCIYLSVRQVIEATWINDRDQFYAPNLLWKEDKEFQSDCLAFTLFHGQNKISSQNGINHFIPFTESEIGAKSAFESDFMTRFMRGKVELDNSGDSLFGGKSMSEKLEFSPEAKAVFEAGKEIFAYYHAQDFSTKPYNVNASLYDIKEFFQGRNSQGKMNLPSKAEDSHYKTLIATLTDTLNTLAKKLEPKIYEYGFLKE